MLDVLGEVETPAPLMLLSEEVYGHLVLSKKHRPL